MTNATIARVTGVYDVLPPQINRYRQLEAALTGSFEQYGYLPLALPLLEHSELYLRRAGENIVSQMYDFQHRGRRLCLRPEMTASTMRAYIEHMADWPLPARFYYSGPVFRYEKAQGTPHRQFTQVGLELIGAGGALADAEVIRVACAALDAAGLKQYRLVIGHVGILNAFLNNLDIDGQLRSFLLLNMETLRTQGDAHLIEHLRELYPAFGRLSASDGAASDGDSAGNATSLFQVLRGMSGEEARALVIELLESLNLKLDENRDRDEITERLLTKLRRGDQTAALNTALAFMSQLSQLKGEPQNILSACKKLLTHYNVSNSVIEYIDSLLHLLDAFGVSAHHVTLDLGISLGLQYYTGLIFEIHHNSLTEGQQLCGGGRYDDLIDLLGGPQPQPATGFSFGLEWVYKALEAEGGYDGGSAQTMTQALVTASREADLAGAAQVAERVRALGWRAELDLCARPLGDSLLYAQNRGIRLVIAANDQSDASLTLYRTDTQQALPIALDELAQALHSMESDND